MLHQVLGYKILLPVIFKDKGNNELLDLRIMCK